MQLTGLFLILLLNSNKGMVSNYLKEDILKNQKGRCGLCKKQLNIYRPHEIHHLDHNFTNNERRNLLALCCNCHQAHHRYNIPVFPYYLNDTILSKKIKMYNYYEKFYD